MKHTFPKTWRKQTPTSASYVASFKTRHYAEVNARNIWTDYQIAITSMPRTKKHRIFQLWIYT